jgi:TIR domain
MMARVFISHRGADGVEAAKLAGDLRALGHTVWIDQDEIKAGDSLIQKIGAGIERADALVLCVSAREGSPWLDREWMSTLARQLNGAQVRLIPALVTGRTLPVMLADLKYADLQENWVGGVAEISEAIQ